jgi:enamine deaminase RidA (YjgF/YER057c/UK114 family)
LNVYDRLRELGWSIPPVPAPAGAYLPARLWGDTLYVSGQTPKVNDQLVLLGKVGLDLTVEEAKEGARLATLACLSQAQAVIGDLNRVEAVLKVMVYVNSAPGFGEQPKVGNGASETLIALFGEKGKHARTSIGMAELPSGASVEVDLILGVRD